MAKPSELTQPGAPLKFLLAVQTLKLSSHDRKIRKRKKENKMSGKISNAFKREEEDEEEGS